MTVYCGRESGDGTYKDLGFRLSLVTMIVSYCCILDNFQLNNFQQIKKTVLNWPNELTYQTSYIMYYPDYVCGGGDKNKIKYINKIKNK